MRLKAQWGRRAQGGTARALEQREENGLQEREVIEQIAAEFTTEELQEFLEADRHPIEADPLFKEQLREKLWRLLQRSLRGTSDDD